MKCYTVLVLLVLWLVGCKDNSAPVATTEEYYPLYVGTATAWVKVGASPEEHMKGLMYRYTLPPDSGMLFAYAQSKELSFWMKNTFIPLDIAFIRSDMTISEILSMAKDDGRPDYLLPHYRSQEKVQYALEMPQNWFQQHGIRTSNKIVFAASLQKRVENLAGQFHE